MSLFGLIVLVLVLGFVSYLVDKYAPVAPPFKLAVHCIIILAVIYFVLKAFFPGLLTAAPPVIR